jgi:acyl carrier protein
VNLDKELRALVDDTLNLGGRAAAFGTDSPLLGAVPELDSMGVVNLLTAMEERLGLLVDDDEIDASIFRTWGSLFDFVSGKMKGGA